MNEEQSTVVIHGAGSVTQCRRANVILRTIFLGPKDLNITIRGYLVIAGSLALPELLNSPAVRLSKKDQMSFFVPLGKQWDSE